MKRPDGVVLIAILHFLIGTFFAIAALTLLVIPIPAIWFSTEGMDRIWAMWGVGIGLGFTVMLGSLALVAGWGLLALKEWARWLTIALALLGLFTFPIGTVIGALIILYLLQANVKAVFVGHPSQIATI